VLVVLLAAACASATGCVRVELPESQKSGASTETTSAPLGDAKAMKAAIRLGVGELKMSSVASTTAAFNATFIYQPASWKPDVKFRSETVSGAPTAALYVDQSEDAKPLNLGVNKNSWDINLADGVPLDLSIKTGVGQSTVDLRGLDVRSLEAVTGAGEATIDLGAPRPSDMTGTITSGVGNLTLRLPSSVGVKVTGSGDGVGDLSAVGFTQNGDALTNDAWGKPGPKIELRITRGVGNVRLELTE
jgi:hypothetical protein